MIIGRTIMPIMLALLLCTGGASQGADVVSCTVIADARSGDVLIRDGRCDERFPPFSSFKLPLAAIGYDAGILMDAAAPRWEWHAGLTAPERDRKPVDPAIWQKDSVLWYSREITRLLGAGAFGRYMMQLDYGNGDVSGIPGQNDGLTHAWLGRSLTISPDEQVVFMRRLLAGALPLAADAQAKAVSIMPAFAAGGWTVHGKTGSGWVADRKGAYFRDRPLGWFVGWAERGDQVVVFARLRVDTMRRDDYLGPIMRDALLADLPVLLP